MAALKAPVADRLFDPKTEEAKIYKAIRKSNFKSAVEINPDTTFVRSVSTKQTKISLSHIGCVILDNSKLMMAEHMFRIMQVFGDKCRLAGTDTDSLFLHFSCSQAELDAGMTKLKDHFDTSNYPEDHPLHDKATKGLLGRLKNESLDLKSMPTAFVGLQAKSYAVETAVGTEKSTAKGIPRAHSTMIFDAYKSVLVDPNNSLPNIEFHRIDRTKGQLSFVESVRRSLSGFDDKRYLPETAGVWETLPHGYAGMALGDRTSTSQS